MKPFDYDVIVVGLGPAGSTVARNLSERGFRVLGLDRARFPRHKPCGGGLSPKVLDILDPDVTSLIERVIYGLMLTFQDGTSIEIKDTHPVAYMVSRTRLDQHLLEKARDVGVEVREEEPVKKVIPHEDRVDVITPKNTYSARIVVGADGANSVVATSIGLRHYGWRAALLEGEIWPTPEAPRFPEEMVLIEFDAVPFGYAWIFPKADHLSMGVGGLQKKIRNPRPYYLEFQKRHPFLNPVAQEERYGHTLPAFSKKRVWFRDRCLLVGDAGGLADPFIGEGIYYAIRSGQIAAAVIDRALRVDTAALSEYNMLLEREIIPELQAARKLAIMAYTFPEAFRRQVEKKPTILLDYFEVLRGKQSYEWFVQRLRESILKGFMIHVSLLRPIPEKTRETYDRIAPRYDLYNTLWEWLSKRIQHHLVRLLKECIPPGGVVLDAGGGTGWTTSLVLSKTRVGRINLVDLSSGMLAQARKKLADPRVHLVQADMYNLPYPDETFDVVVSTWALETLEHPKQAVQEFLRVIKPEGYVIYLFSSLPQGQIERMGARFIERLFGNKFAFRFLPPREQPYHHCAQSRLMTFWNGLITLVVLRKCCNVDDTVAPCRNTGASKRRV